ncbi:alpha/beta hydrolase [Sinomicrobium weinanense]|uniref:Alpha/beta hydrolase n=1 Tax=Sinomicrobium weinanense TaxID=2842200 RepID=A0A926Q1C7_9FLAO|nr:alpha/beta hydrolase [Sinomicrobium weinanense]MBC9794679.1 alpha/beta hydrolase [Sinomicrobium weinanense]MBU3124164.1 alpha/beta hydrolase [Sinomicrobium weinanense]
MKICLILSVFTLLSTTISHGQNTTIKVWPETIPGAMGNPDYKKETAYANNGKSPRIKKVTDPTLEIFLPAKDKANGTAILICPGGGYSALAIDHEGRDIAAWFNKLGIAAFVLQYRLPSDAIMKDKSIGPLQDGQEAIRIIRRNAAKWNIKTDRVGIIGFSAGGHLASTVSTHFSEEVYEPGDAVSARPDFSMLVYPVISMDQEIAHKGSRTNLIGEHPSPNLVKRFSNELQVKEDTPPAFLVHSTDDNVVQVENSIRYYLALKDHQVPAEMHIYRQGGHGYGMGRSDNTESSWPEALERWLKMNKLL